jgi:hypothetical protein
MGKTAPSLTRWREVWLKRVWIFIGYYLLRNWESKKSSVVGQTLYSHQIGRLLSELMYHRVEML